MILGTAVGFVVLLTLATATWWKFFYEPPISGPIADAFTKAAPVPPADSEGADKSLTDSSLFSHAPDPCKLLQSLGDFTDPVKGDGSCKHVSEVADGYKTYEVMATAVPKSTDGGAVTEAVRRYDALVREAQGPAFSENDAKFKHFFSALTGPGEQAFTRYTYMQSNLHGYLRYSGAEVVFRVRNLVVEVRVQSPDDERSRQLNLVYAAARKIAPTLKP
ncbi:hypothetical protein GCM10010191_95520 [Actinomadura vinacea]|uniref:DUF3558 domain-containing protein n=2 Tax=Actinomadura vinacea TaxID=115336 RepID=A0ABP5XM39_9ACTN